MKHLILDKMPSNFELILAGDYHEGNEDICINRIKRLVQRIKSRKNCFISHGGDQIEAITVTDKRYNLASHGGGKKSRIDIQRNMFMEDLEGIPYDRHLWILDGNHERTWENQFRPSEDIAKVWETTYANGPMLKAIFPGFRLLDWHGYGFINSKAGDMMQRNNNNIISLKRKLRDLPGADCEVICSHHFHRLMIGKPNRTMELISDKNKNELVQHYTKPERIWIDAKKELYRIPEDDKWFVCSGSFLRGYVEDHASYSEWAGFRPTELGVLTITVQNDKIKDIKPDYLV